MTLIQIPTSDKEDRDVVTSSNANKALKDDSTPVPPIPPPQSVAERFTTEWETLFNFPKTLVQDKKTRSVVQRPLVWAPPT